MIRIFLKGLLQESMARKEDTLLKKRTYTQVAQIYQKCIRLKSYLAGGWEQTTAERIYKKYWIKLLKLSSQNYVQRLE